MSTPRMLGVILFALWIVGFSVSFWIIVPLIILGYIYELCKNLLKAGGWLDEFKDKIARNYIDQQMRRVTRKEIYDLSKKKANEQ